MDWIRTLLFINDNHLEMYLQINGIRKLFSSKWKNIFHLWKNLSNINGLLYLFSNNFSNIDTGESFFKTKNDNLNGI